MFYAHVTFRRDIITYVLCSTFVQYHQERIVFADAAFEMFCLIYFAISRKFLRLHATLSIVYQQYLYYLLLQDVSPVYILCLLKHHNNITDVRPGYEVREHSTIYGQWTVFTQCSGFRCTR